MRFPSECCQIHETLRQTMPHLTEAQSKVFALWVFGTITAQSGRRNALAFAGGFYAVRQRLREWLYDGARPLRAVAESDRRPRPLSSR